MGATKEAQRATTLEQLMELYQLSELGDLQETPEGSRFRLWAINPLTSKERYLGCGCFTKILTLPEQEKIRIIRDTENRIGYGVLDKCFVAEFKLDSGIVVTSDKSLRWERDDSAPLHTEYQVLP